MDRLSADVSFDDGRFYYRYRVVRPWWWECECGKAIAAAVNRWEFSELSKDNTHTVGWNRRQMKDEMGHGAMKSWLARMVD